MGELLAGIKERIAQLKGQRPIYREMVDFYELVLEEQEAAQRHLKIPSVDLDAEPLKLRREQGRPVLERGDFDIDLETAKKLFYAISAIGKGATPKMTSTTVVENVGTTGPEKLSLKFIRSPYNNLRRKMKDLPLLSITMRLTNTTKTDITCTACLSCREKFIPFSITE